MIKQNTYIFYIGLSPRVQQSAIATPYDQNLIRLQLSSQNTLLSIFGVAPHITRWRYPTSQPAVFTLPPLPLRWGFKPLSTQPLAQKPNDAGCGLFFRNNVKHICASSSKLLPGRTSPLAHGENRTSYEQDFLKSASFTRSMESL